MNKKYDGGCPICLGRLADISNAAAVCTFHEEWIVTQCRNCNRTVFSESVGECRDCFGDGHYYKPPKSNPDPRYLLVVAGIDDYE
jgi:hypothetical protein